MHLQGNLSRRLQPQHTSMQCWQPATRLANRGLRPGERRKFSTQSPCHEPSRSSFSRASLSPGFGLRQPQAHARRLLQPLRTVRPTQTAALAAPAVADMQLSSAESRSHSSARPALSAAVVIIGGGPAGLASALMLARRGYPNIKVRRNTSFFACIIIHSAQALTSSTADRTPKATAYASTFLMY